MEYTGHAEMNYFQYQLCRVYSDMKITLGFCDPTETSECAVVYIYFFF